MATLIVKLVLTGESCVGKTSLLLTYTDGKFPPWLHTIGIDFKIVKTHVDGRPVKVQIWDPSGGVSSSSANAITVRLRNSNTEGNTS